MIIIVDFERCVYVESFYIVNHNMLQNAGEQQDKCYCTYQSFVKPLQTFVSYEDCLRSSRVVFKGSFEVQCNYDNFFS